MSTRLWSLLIPLVACCASPPPIAPPPPIERPPPAAPSAASAPSEPPPAGAPAYDLVIAGGRLIDPASGRDGVFDVAVTRGRIASIAPSIDASRALRRVDARGLVVTPGFVDLHAHVFLGSSKEKNLVGTPHAARADGEAPRSCTTTVVDAGSAGHRTFARFAKEIIAPARTRVLAFLNIVGEGMRGGRYEQDLGDMSPDATAAVMRASLREIVGVKVAHYAGSSFEPVHRAVRAAKLGGGRVMVDFGAHRPELSLEALLMEQLRPGDIYTHMYASVRGRTAIVDDRGALRPYVKRAHERGIVFDLGHGSASFLFRQAAPAIAAGLPPDTISSDMHRLSLAGEMRDIVAVLSKLGALGISLEDRIRMTTSKPASVIDRPDLGRLVEGGEADIAVLGIERGSFAFFDVRKGRVDGREHLRCELLIRAGEVLWDPHQRAARPSNEP